MGRYSKKRKQEEARMRAENAKKTFVENILEFSEKQQEELERLERRINRKKILINKKYRVAYDKIQKEEREKQQRIFEKYDRYIEKRQNEIKGDLESIEEKKNKISLRQFLLKVILERETGVKTAWTEESSDVAVEAKISISGGTVKSKLRALQSEFIKRDTIPDGLYAYDVRHDDECRGIPCEIATFVMVNHWGTIILAEPLELPDDGRRYIDEDTDWNYAPLDGEDTANHKPCTTISDFMTAYAH